MHPDKSIFQKEVNIKTTCQKPVVKVISLKNPFKEASSFNCSLVEYHSRNVGQLRGFSIQNSTIYLPIDQAVNMHIAFHPFSVGEYTGRLIFSSQSLGDFALKIQGYSKPPSSNSVHIEGRVLVQVETTEPIEFYLNTFITEFADDSVYKIHYQVNEPLLTDIEIPIRHLSKYSTMEWIAKYIFSPLDLERIRISGRLWEEVTKALQFNQPNTSNVNFSLTYL